MTSFTTLPLDIHRRILNELDIEDLIRVETTCHTLSEAANDHHVWLPRAKRLWSRFPIMKRCRPPLLSLSTQELKQYVIFESRLESRWNKTERAVANLTTCQLHHSYAQFVALLPGGDYGIIVSYDGRISLQSVTRRQSGVFAISEVFIFVPPNAREVLMAESLNTIDGDTLIIINSPSSVSAEKVEVFRISASPPSIVLIQTIEVEFILQVTCVYESFLILFDGFRNVWITPLNQDPAPPNLDIYKIILTSAPLKSDICVLSARTIAVGNFQQICIYHIPDINLSFPNPGHDLFKPVWEWTDPEDTENMLPVFSTSKLVFWNANAQRPPTLHLLFEAHIHIITFQDDRSKLVVDEHRIIDTQPPPQPDSTLHMKTCMGLWFCFYDAPTFTFSTMSLEDPTRWGQIQVCIDNSPIADGTIEDVDFDEISGRIMIAVTKEAPNSGIFFIDPFT